ncbi:hypothetical protein A2962_01840 [Candidatus Woesebacteria bacterium RIFCSPLOWO2_01_FULL_39_61]|nr:MAG: hypothetical protein A2692_02840 [Candidatus Woesebacteria bacterium RIFCSPHIGHO2_01_FULL_39_95]OGM38403.1 MAG: hypothetical protein A3E13_02025 [Candidatus Woesebacteria bacterium RIFCSPHIGHO2_12_FULL_40_20]OGM66770.1 MAG: hypothetical protein A2962_01840 [Candidatus Woesebacteria bacterium RIFCSPLOWO2_01_FULL_39_61]OGM74753.1 MAG: hypothetical protein A3H19_00245 [Candidatus Woesebacteria bacterium RIFCSPLOWO2_12_FULL_39_9]
METLSSLKIQSWLTWFLRGMLIFGFLILAARLVDLSIIRGNYFRSLAEGNRIRRFPIVAPRGNIFARGGELIVGNKEVKLHLTFDSESGYQKLKDVEGVNDNEIIKENQRNYLSGETFAHITGYLGEVSEQELGKIRAECPEKGPRHLGALVGRGGLEQEYDCLLTGIDGEELIEVDAMGKKVRTLGRKKPIPGSDLHTTIDFGLQMKVVELMRGKKGAVVITDGSGEILSLYSSPSYDPNVFVSNDADKISQLLNDPDLPLFDRVISGKFHPGSVYKPLVVISALEEVVIDEDYTYEDTGQIVISTPYGNFSYKNWYFTQYGGVEGKIGLERALTRSTDTFFYKLGELTGVEKLTDWSNRFGLDQKTGVDLPGEIPGFVPSPEWKIKEKGERWFLGNTYHMSIGQGDLALTPIGINNYIATIASDAKHCKPKIINKEETNYFLNKFKSSDTQDFQCEDMDINKDSLNLVKKGMMGACASGGTGFTFFDFEEKSKGVKVACKTGTAETENGEPHAWFTVFAPVANPQIVATVLVENGGEGSRVAGPPAREIFNYWFKLPTRTPSPAHE